MTIHQFLFVSLDLFLLNKASSNLQFVGNLLHDVLGRLYSSFPILHSSSFCLLKPDQPLFRLL